MISLGIDISLTGTGIAVLDDGKGVYRGVIRSKPSGKKPLDELWRLLKINKEIASYIDKYKPEIIAIEGLAFMAKGTSLVQLAALNYMVRREALERDTTFVIVAPSSLKKLVTGKGNSQKDQMMLETYKRYGVSIL